MRRMRQKRVLAYCDIVTFLFYTAAVIAGDDASQLGAVGGLVSRIHPRTVAPGPACFSLTRSCLAGKKNCKSKILALCWSNDQCFNFTLRMAWPQKLL